MQLTTTSRVRHGAMAGIIAAALLLAAGCTPGATDPTAPPTETPAPPTETTAPPDSPKPLTMSAFVAGGSGADQFSGVAVAGDGSIVTVGYTSSTDGDFLPSHGKEDALIVKYSPDGAKQWTTTLGGTGFDTLSGVAVAGDGSIIAVGYTASTDGDFPASGGAMDVLIVKYSPDGTQQWAKTMGGSDIDRFNGVAVAGDGSIIAVGITSSTGGDFPASHGREDALIVKYGPDGAQAWAKTSGGSDSDYFWGVAVAGDGSIIAVGDTFSPGGDFPRPKGENDALIVKYAPDGTQQWVKTGGGSDIDHFVGVAVAGDGGIIAVGQTFSPDGDFAPVHGNGDALMVRYSPDGTQDWAKTAGGNETEGFAGVATAIGGSIITAGWTPSTDGDFPRVHSGDDALLVIFSPGQ